MPIKAPDSRRLKWRVEEEHQWFMSLLFKSGIAPIRAIPEKSMKRDVSQRERTDSARTAENRLRLRESLDRPQRPLDLLIGKLIGNQLSCEIGIIGRHIDHPVTAEVKEDRSFLPLFLDRKSVV